MQKNRRPLVGNEGPCSLCRAAIRIAVIFSTALCAYAIALPRLVTVTSEPDSIHSLTSGDAQHFVVRVANWSPEALKVVGLEEYCGAAGCVRIEGLPITLAPFSQSPLQGEFRAGPPGVHDLNLRFYTDRPTTPQLQFSLRVAITPRTAGAMAPRGDFSVLRSPPRPGTKKRPMRVSVTMNSHFVVPVGDMLQGSKASLEVIVVNDSGCRWNIDSFKTTCDCLMVTCLKQDPGPPQTVTAALRLDLRGDPEFRGAIAPEVLALSDRGDELFCLVVRAHVRAQSRQPGAFDFNPGMGEKQLRPLHAPASVTD